MAGPKHPILRTSAQGTVPADNTRKPGELYANFPDKRLGIIDENELPVDLVAVRFFSVLGVYTINDVVVNDLDGIMYQCIQDNGPGTFAPLDWTTALDSFLFRLLGFGLNGRHEEFAGDLDSILKNSVFAITSASVTNDPAEFDAEGIITTDVHTSASNAVQTIAGATETQAYNIWRRTRNGSAWGAWALLTDGASMTIAADGTRTFTTQLKGIEPVDDEDLVRKDYVDALPTMLRTGDRLDITNVPVPDP